MATTEDELRAEIDRLTVADIGWHNTCERLRKAIEFVEWQMSQGAWLGSEAHQVVTAALRVPSCDLQKNQMNAATPPAAALPWVDLLMKLQEEHEWLLKQLQPVPCPCCGDGETFLVIDDWLMHRVCNKCGSGLTGLEESRWNIRNKARRLVMQQPHNAN